MTTSRLAKLLAVLLSICGPACSAAPAKPEALITLDLAGLDLNAAVESLSTQSGEVFVVAALPQELGPKVTLTAVTVNQAIQIIAAAYGVCVDAEQPLTAFRSCRALFATHGQQAPIPSKSAPSKSAPFESVPFESTRGVALLGVETRNGIPRDPSAVVPGAVVLRVLPGSVAATAGLQPGDTIVTFDGRAIGNPVELRDAVNTLQLGSQVTLEVLRNGQRETLTAQF